MHKVTRKLIRDLRRDGYEVAAEGRSSNFGIYRGGEKLTTIHSSPRKPENYAEQVRRRLRAIESGKKTPGRRTSGKGSTLPESLDNRRRKR